MNNITFVLLFGAVFLGLASPGRACEEATAKKSKTAAKSVAAKIKPVVKSKLVVKNQAPIPDKSIPKTKAPIAAKVSNANFPKLALKKNQKTVQAKSPTDLSPASKGRQPAQIKSKKKKPSSKKISQAPVPQKGFHFIPLPPKKKVASLDAQKRSTSSVGRERVVSYFKKDRVAIRPDGEGDGSAVSAKLVPNPSRTKVGTKHSVREADHDQAE